MSRTLRALDGFAEDDRTDDRAEEVYRRTLAGESRSIDVVRLGLTIAVHIVAVDDASGDVSMGVVLAIDDTTCRRVSGIEALAKVRRCAPAP